MRSLLIRVLVFAAGGFAFFFFCTRDAGSVDDGSTDGIPHLRRQGTATQLVVDRKPFLILGGELANSSSSSLTYMDPVWDCLGAQNLNTVLAGVSWELTEPEEGRFDFQLLDGLVTKARIHGLHLVLLWFGSWKNGASSYAPVWVKRNPARFPRVRLLDGKEPEVLSPLSLATADADARAFSVLMKHLREIDSRNHTVLLVQVENEVGVLGDSRDRSPAADAVFAGPVPDELSQYLATHQAELVPELRTRWKAAGAKTAGNWTEVFGPGAATDEIFMAWHYARYVDRVAAAGVAAYPIPLYANAWQDGPKTKPGDYPSGGPLVQVLNLWQAAAPHLALVAPDLYGADFEERCRLYSLNGNALFIPETTRSEQSSRNLFLAFGVYNAIGFSPFAIDGRHPVLFTPTSETELAAVGTVYGVLRQIAPLILAHQGKGEIAGFVLDKQHPSLVAKLGGADLEISLDELFGKRADRGAGMVIAAGNGEFFGIGSGFRVIFRPSAAATGKIGIGAVDEGVFRDGSWVPGRRLNGDEDDQGHAWRFEPWATAIEHCNIYRY